MSDPQLERLRARANRLLDLYLSLATRAAILRPLLFDPTVVQGFTEGARTNGFEMLRRVLFGDCIQSLVQIANDKAKTTTSVRRMVGKLRDASCLHELREQYVQVFMPTGSLDPRLDDYFRREEQERREVRGKEFDETWSRLQNSWSRLESLACWRALKDARNKIIAHAELGQTAGGNYEFVSVDPAITAGDFFEALGLVESIVMDLFAVVGCGGFLIDEVRAQVAEVGAALWRMPIGAKGDAVTATPASSHP